MALVNAINELCINYHKFHQSLSDCLNMDKYGPIILLASVFENKVCLINGFNLLKRPQHMYGRRELGSQFHIQGASRPLG